jgi:hypothetical protein
VFRRWVKQFYSEPRGEATAELAASTATAE